MRILYVTTIAGTMAFFLEHFKMLLQEGHIVELACNCELPLMQDIQDMGLKVHDIPFSRSPLSKDNLKAYRQLKAKVEQGYYDIVHCHTPNASVCTRLACRNKRIKETKVLYTAHGFHFFKGAPLKNWLFYYPVERFCSRFTDALITINQEDYALAQKKMKTKQVYYVPGVGIDLSKFENLQFDYSARRRDIGVPEDAVLLLSVGELNRNKNHQVIIRALAKLNDSSIHYAVAGQGPLKHELLELARQCRVESQVHILGFRRDIVGLNYIADIFCFPSKREGLGLAAIEAMACGLPIITSDVQGINDYNKNGINGYKVNSSDVNAFAQWIASLAKDKMRRQQIGHENKESVKKYDMVSILEQMKMIYSDLMQHS